MTQLCQLLIYLDLNNYVKYVSSSKYVSCFLFVFKLLDTLYH